MKYGDFLTQLAGFVNRKDVSLSQLDFFVNTAKNELQLTNNFNFIKKVSPVLNYPNIPNTGVRLPIDYKAMAGDFAVQFKSTQSSTVFIPIKGMSKADARRRIYSLNQPFSSMGLEDLSLTGIVPNPGGGPPIPTLPLNAPVQYYAELINNGWFLFTFPEILSCSLIADYYAWIPDYNNVLAVYEDFLLLYAPQVLLWGALRVQNRFVKEDIRTSIDAQAEGTALAALIDFDSRIDHQTDYMDLD